MRIAIVTERVKLRVYLASIVHDLPHSVVTFYSVENVNRALSDQHFDLLILDWSLPNSAAPALVTWVQSYIRYIPKIIVMTNRSIRSERVSALRAGADDYFTKSDGAGVIGERIVAILQSAVSSANFRSEETFGDYRFHRFRRTVHFGEIRAKLSPMEFELAELLFRNKGRSLPRHLIMERIWRVGAFPGTRTLDVHVSKIRTKLYLSGEFGFCIVSVPKFGYRLETVGTELIERASAAIN